MSSEHDLSAQNSSGYIYFAPAYESDIHTMSPEARNHSDGVNRNEIPKPTSNKSVTKHLDDSLSGKRNYDSFGTIIDDSPISISSGYNSSREKHDAESEPEKLFESMNISEPRPITPELDTEFQQRPVSSELECQSHPGKQMENTSEKTTYKTLSKKNSRVGNNKINESNRNSENYYHDSKKGVKSSNVISRESNCESNHLHLKQNNSKVYFNPLVQVGNISPIAASPVVSTSGVVQDREFQSYDRDNNGVKTLTLKDPTRTPTTPASNVHNPESNVSTNGSNVATVVYDKLTPASSVLTPASNKPTLTSKHPSPGPKPESIKIDSNTIDEMILTYSDEEIPLKKLSKCLTTSEKSIHDDEDVKVSCNLSEISNDNNENESQVELEVFGQKISLSKTESSDIVKKQVSEIYKGETSFTTNVVGDVKKLTNQPSNTKKIITTPSANRTLNVYVSKQESTKQIQPRESQFGIKNSPNTRKGSSNNIIAKSSAVPSRVGLVSKNQRSIPSISDINNNKIKPDDKEKPRWK